MNQLISELKAYVFAQYIGQRVLNGPVLKNATVTELAFMADLEVNFLQLRPLSSITDDEAIEVAKLAGFEGLSDNQSAWYGQETVGDSYLCFAAYQYLQQQGFALPVFFKGTHYTVESLVAENIITLKN